MRVGINGWVLEKREREDEVENLRERKDGEIHVDGFDDG